MSILRGPVWKAHREAANTTMIDSDNVLLLHPATPTWAFVFGNKQRPRAGANEARSDLIVATIYYLDAPVDAGFVESFEKNGETGRDRFRRNGPGVFRN